MLCALAGLLYAPPGTAAPGAPADGPDPIDFAVVVDVSASIDEKALDLEAEAAALISQGEISERSRATVIGFGSAEKTGQQPVYEACPPTVVDTAGRQELSDCVKDLTDREEHRLGPGTDFPAALSQALERLAEGGPEGAPKVVFLLTDGKLDVRDSPSYGADPTSRQENARKRLDDLLAQARREKVQIWPLGFGNGIDRKALRDMAARGYRDGCADISDAKPRMRVVQGAADVDKALQETFAAARCAKVEQGGPGEGPGELRVTIPPLATDGSITVIKRDPRVTTTYYDPRGRKVPVEGTFDGSRFELSGQNSPVEALRVKDPLPGEWRVRVKMPDGRRDGPVTVRAIWQGVLRSFVSLEPSAPRPGEEVVVQMRMQTRRGVVISDPGQLAGVKVTARLSGDGFDPVDVVLRDDGKGPDERADDVRYTAGLRVPREASGKLELTGEMAAPGIRSDRRPFATRISLENPKVTAGVTLDGHTVHPGGRVTGTLTVRNNDSAPHTLRLELRDQGTASPARIDPSRVTVEPGARERVPFDLRFDADAAPGEAGGTIAVVDATDADRTLRTSFLAVTVEPEPTWWDRWWWAVALACGVLVVGAGVVAARVLYGRRRDSLHGLVVELRREGRSLGELRVRGSGVRSYHFAVEGPSSARPSLRRRNSGSDGTYRLWRRDGGLRLRTPGGREQAVPRGGAVPLDHGLELLVRGERAPSRDRRSGTAGRDSGSRPRPAGGTPRAGAGRATAGRGTTGRTAPGGRPGRGSGGHDPAF
ncbi:hypothetical protein GCM10010405_35970 [Streptomyces macrosporus]|uniref:VWFA domain-containing protein n=1 Tax=Streptomyces macrosporus TaxID=44032 RepID=A0ABP5XBQ7_9ACTN